MAVEYTGLDIPMIAAEDLSAMQYKFVHQADDTTVDMLDSTAELALGILQNAPESGEIAVVRIEGTSKLVFNAAVVRGRPIKAEYVAAGDNGKGQFANNDKDIVRAMCLTAPTAEDKVGAVLLCGPIKGSISSSSLSSSSSSGSSSSSSNPGA